MILLAQGVATVDRKPTERIIKIGRFAVEGLRTRADGKDAPQVSGVGDVAHGLGNQSRMGGQGCRVEQHLPNRERVPRQEAAPPVVERLPELTLTRDRLEMLPIG